jgi:hypothetical protein
MKKEIEKNRCVTVSNQEEAWILADELNKGNHVFAQVYPASDNKFFVKWVFNSEKVGI